jgi:hypothetical protein
MVVVGLGRFGEALVVEAARRWAEPPRGSGDLRVSVVDRDAHSKVQSLRLRKSHLERVCELHPFEMEFDSPEFRRGSFLAGSEAQPPVASVYVCVDDESAALSAALVLHRRLRGSGVPIVIRMEQGGGLATLFSEGAREGRDFSSLHVFPLLERTCKPELLFDGTTEQLARVIHEGYLCRWNEEGASLASNPSLVPWERLSESLKRSNRARADRIARELRAMDCDLAPLADPDGGGFAFTHEEVETLAALEHARWVGERLRDGWSLGSEKDLARRQSPYLVPWRDLPREIQDLNRRLVRELPSLLARAGFQIDRLGPSARSG